MSPWLLRLLRHPVLPPQPRYISNVNFKLIFKAAAAAAAPVQTAFTVKLVKVDAKTKVKAIKAIKDLMPNLNLVEVCTCLDGAHC